MLDAGEAAEGDRMALSEITVAIEAVQLGMYVCRLDRPWDGTPYPIQGVLLEREEQIHELAALCDEVTIDVERCHTHITPRKRALSVRRPPRPRDALDEMRGRAVYVDQATLVDELPAARIAYENLHGFASQVMADLRAGRALPALDLDKAVAPVVQSVLRCSDAVFWLNCLRQRSNYEYAHALNCTTLAVALGRHLGFPEDALVRLACGGLLLDVGKARLPAELLAQEGPLDEAQMQLARQHIAHGLDILGEIGERNPDVVAMVGMHHERMDGSGYPHGLRGVQIPLFGRIAAIVDSFDAMVSDRAYCKGMARHEALQELYRNRGTLYQAELVEQFTQCIGVYPTGSLVELSSGHIAIVMAQNRHRHLCPRVMLLTTPDKEVDPEFRQVELVDSAGDDGQPPMRVLRPLPPGAYGLDPTELYL
jgi:HD-GYP domain-containing protein (c-di-GMP phosphodiesterase class II)